MNNSHAKGTFHDIKGKVKEEIGHSTGNDKMEREGIAEQVKGKAQKTWGDAKDAVKKGVDKVLNPNDKSY